MELPTDQSNHFLFVYTLRCFVILLRGTIVNRTYGTHKNQYIYFEVYRYRFYLKKMMLRCFVILLLRATIVNRTYGSHKTYTSKYKCRYFYFEKKYVAVCCYTTMTGNHSKQDLRFTQKPVLRSIYLSLFLLETEIGPMCYGPP